MRRSLTLLIAVLTVLMGTITTVSAQDATPTAGATGGAVIYGADGQPEAEAVVHSVIDPFEDYDPSSSPDRGMHFVAAIVTISAVAERTVDVSSFSFYLVDTEGFSYPVTFLFRTTESTNALPDFNGGTIEPGQSMSGAMFFQVVDGAAPALIYYQPSFDRVVTLTDLRDAAVAEGDAVEVIDAGGRPFATMTVEETIIPVEDYETSSAPKRGFEFAGVNVTIENTGETDLEVDPFTFTLVDDLGFSYTAYGAFRTADGEAAMPSLQSTTLAAGESVTGLLTYSVLAGTKPGFVYYAPSFDRQVRLAEYGDAQAPAPTGDMPDFPAVDPGTDPGTSDPGTDEPGTDEPVTVTEGCEGVIEWGTATIATLGESFGVFDFVSGIESGDFSSLDAAEVRTGAETMAGAAETQGNIDTPEVAQDAQDALIAFYTDGASKLEALADAIEGGDEAEISAAGAAFMDVMAAFDEGSDLANTFDALTEACPELDSVG